MTISVWIKVLKTQVEPGFVSPINTGCSGSSTRKAKPDKLKLFWMTTVKGLYALRNGNLMLMYGVSGPKSNSSFEVNNVLLLTSKGVLPVVKLANH